MIKLGFAFEFDTMVFIYWATRRLGDEQTRLCCDWRLEWINCTGRYLPCLRYYWCTIEENIIEKTKRKKKEERKDRGREKTGLYSSVGSLLKNRIKM